MSHLRFTICLITVALISSCATNQDLVNLEEVDDIYYQASPNGSRGSVTASTNTSSPDLMNGASNAERSYYQQTPYTPEAESSEYVEEENSDEDYYDEDYARRLENFHNDEKQPQYNYGGEDIYQVAENTAPQVNWNVGFGYSSFGPGMGMGMSYGNMFGNPYGGWNNCYGYAMYPNYGYNPYAYNPYGYGGFYGGGGYGMGYANGYNNGYYNGFNDGMYGGGYGGGYYGASADRGGRQIVNEQRPSSSTSTRTNRGGIVNPPGDNGGGGRPSGIGEQATTKQSDLQRALSGQRPSANATSTRPSGSIGTTLGRTLAPRTTRNYSTTATTRQTRATVSPYARSQQYAPTRSTNTTRTTRSTYSPNRSTNSRYTPQSNTLGNRSRSTPSYSPSRSSGGSRGTTTSPSRPSSPSPSRGRR